MKPAMFARGAAIAVLLLASAVPVANAAGLRTSAQTQIGHALQTVATIRRRTELRHLMETARGILIVAQFSRGGFIFGGRGGNGVFLLRRPDGAWSDPSFYHVGTIRFGSAGGGWLGPVVFLLMSRKAVARFLGSGRFSLGADGRLTVAGYSPNRLPSRGDDVIVWFDLTGVRGGGRVRAAGLHWDGNETRAFYGDASLTPRAVLRSRAHTPRGAALQRALPGT